MKTIIAFDPSICQCGWAISEDKKEISGVIKPAGVELADRLRSLSSQVKTVCLQPNISMPSHAVIELPPAFSFTRSTSSTGRGINAGALQKLNLAIGTTFATLHSMSITIDFIPVAWKGKMGKDMAVAITKCKNHNAADAVLLNRYYRAGKQFNPRNSGR